METKPLLYGLIGFFIGGFIVSVAATVLDDPNTQMEMDDMSMNQMMNSFEDKTGDAYDEAFLSAMIVHHEGAIAMAKASPERAKHDEIKQLSEDIIAAQEAEIAQMRQWQVDWGYETETSTGMQGMHGAH